MKRGKRLIIIFSSIILAAILGGFWFWKKSAAAYEPSFMPQMSAEKTITADEMKEDVDYLVKVLKDVHPKAYKGLDKDQKDIIKSVYERIDKPMKAGEFYFLVNEIICSFKDAHTFMVINSNKEDRIIELPLIWLKDGMYVREDKGELKKGDTILSLGGKDEAELLKQLAKIIPAENNQWIKERSITNITKEPYLRYMGLIANDSVVVKVKRDDQELEVKLPLVKVGDKKTVQNEKWVRYTIDKENSLGILTLDQCNYNSEYKSVVKEFFVEVAANNIKNIAVDVRKNSGGNSGVVDEFISYLDIDKYDSYGGEVRYSKQASKQRSFTPATGYEVNAPGMVTNNKVKDTKLIFKGNIYILTSSITFSSGNWFAVVFKDNNLGKILGEPTGNQPSSYGDVLAFQTPNAGFKFQVSYKKWVRPNIKNDPEDSLHPDIMVYTNIGDFMAGKDTQLEELKKIVNNNK